MTDEIDEALTAAIKKSAADKRAERSHRRQQARIKARTEGAVRVTETRKESTILSARERGRQTRATERAKAKANAATILTREQARRDAGLALIAERQRVRAQNQQDKVALSQRGDTNNRLAGVGSTVVDKATPSGDSNLVMTTIFLIAGLIVVYQLVTRGPQVSGFLGGLGDWIHAISSNTPLFTASTK